MNIDTRNKVRNILHTKLNHSIQRANNIERWIHNQFILNNKNPIWYTYKSRSIIWNLKFDNFKDQLCQKNIDFDKVLNQKPWEIYPDLWKEAIQKAHIREIRKTMVMEKPQDGIYKCRKCHSLKTKHFTYQTRSADEPETIYVSCFLCGSVTKINS